MRETEKSPFDMPRALTSWYEAVEEKGADQGCTKRCLEDRLDQSDLSVLNRIDFIWNALST